MPTVKLNDRTLQALRTRKDTEEFVDASFGKGEFGVRVSITGNKRFFVRYHLRGKRWRLMLGCYPMLSLAAARGKAIDCIRQVQNGEDPQQKQQEYKLAETVSELFELYFAHKEGRMAASTMRDSKAMFHRDIELKIGTLKARDVGKRDIHAILNHIAFERQKPVMSNRVRGLINAVFNYAVSQDLLEYNPVAGVAKAAKESPGERYLSTTEIRSYWAAAGNRTVVERAFFRLLLLTAMRPGEVMKLRWDYIDGRVLTLPSEVVKNKKRHELYLNELAAEELSFLRAVTGSSEYLFPWTALRTYRKSFTEAHSEMMLEMNDKEMDETRWKSPRWTLRDIRRTCETQMRRIIVDGDAVSRVLNHDVSTIRKHYDKNTYFDKKKAALEKWDQWLRKVINGNESNVVNLF